MRFAILSREPNSYSTKRLKESCTKRGHKVKVLDVNKFAIFVEKGNPNLLYDGKSLEKYDGVIPRIGSSVTFYGTAVVRQFEQMGVSCLNSAASILIARDKLRASQVFSRHKVGIPHTAFVKQKTDVVKAIRSVGGAPVIIKLLEGTQGIGVILADTEKVAESIVETLQSTKQNVLIQKFVQESRGKDIRVIVAGGKVIAAMRRKAIGDEFRSNVHRGGEVESIELDPIYTETAISAAQIIGLDVAGVDMLESADGPSIMEVNSSPGLQGIEKATGIDVAGAMVAYLEEKILIPEFDIRQKLTLKNGYGVAEIHIDEESLLKDKLIREAMLKEKEVLILRIIRESITIPTPNGNEQILMNDNLLCYGKLDTLRALIPQKENSKIFQ